MAFVAGRKTFDQSLQRLPWTDKEALASVIEAQLNCE